LTESAYAGETGTLSRYAALLSLASIAVLSPISLFAQGYGGPSLLSRGGNRPGHRGRAPVSLNVYGAVRGTIETGLIAPRVDASGNVIPQDIKGVQAELGAYGSKSWRRSSLGLDYRGDYRKNTNFKTYNGTNQALSLDYNFEPTNRLTTFARIAGGMTNRAFGGFSAPASITQDNFGVPLNDVYDAKTYFNQTSAGVSYRKSARATVTLIGEGFIVKRTSRALISMQGYLAEANYDYRLTRVDTVGAFYNYIRFEYPRIYGGSDIHGFGGTYSRRISRNWSVDALGGLYHVETTGTQLVELSPEIAAILGRPSGVAAFRRVSVQPQVELTGRYQLERSSLRAGYRTGIGPGNGVYVTSRQEALNAGYTYAGTRKLSYGLSFAYSRYHSLGLQLGDFSTVQGGGGVDYKIARHWNLNAQYDHRKFNSPTLRGRTGNSIAVGLSFSPSQIPLSIW
jgi:hypothetical protein